MRDDHADGLQVGVDDHRANEFHASFLQVFRDRIRERIGGFACFIDGFAVCKSFQIVVK